MNHGVTNGVINRVTDGVIDRVIDRVFDGMNDEVSDGVFQWGAQSYTHARRCGCARVRTCTQDHMPRTKNTVVCPSTTHKQVCTQC